MKNIVLAATMATALLFACNDDAFAQQKKKPKNKDLPPMLQTGSLKDARKRQENIRQNNQAGANLDCPPPAKNVEYTAADTTKTIEFTHNLDHQPVQERVPIVPAKNGKKLKKD